MAIRNRRPERGQGAASVWHRHSCRCLALEKNVLAQARVPVPHNQSILIDLGALRIKNLG
jgi:hypothetical protein